MNQVRTTRMNRLPTASNGDTPVLFPDGVKLSDATQFINQPNQKTDPHIKLRRATLDLLLDAADAVDQNGHPFEALLWVDEAAHRALTLLQLMLLKSRPVGPSSAIDRRLRDEHNTALRLASHYRATCTFDSCEVKHPGEALAGIAGALIALFAPVANPVTLNISARALVLDYWRARALISIGSELVTSTLRCSHRSSRGGHIAITLDQSGPHSATLVLEDNIAGVDSKIVGAGYHLIGRLNRILDADLHYKSLKTAGSRVELSFATDGWARSAASNVGDNRRGIQHARH